MIKKWNTLTKSQSKAIMDAFTQKGMSIDLSDQNYGSLRKKLLQASQEVEMSLVDAKKGYEYDLQFGIKMYQILNAHGFTIRQAADDGIWRFIAIKLIPDLVEQRWPGKNAEFNEDRFWKLNRRIYPKTLWWYIHLSWNEDATKTMEMLSKNQNTDTIVQLTERSGTAGYRINVYREIMAQNATFGNRDLFRKVMKLNTVRLKVMEPELTKNGVKGYVKELFDTLTGDEHGSV